jgi:hypothetical protein
MATQKRKRLEKKENIASRLKNYTFIDLKDATMENLKIGYYIKYIKLPEDKTPPYVVEGGKIEDITEDKDNIGHIYRIKIKTNAGATFMVKLKDNKNIFLYYKTMTTAQNKALQNEEWKNNLSTYEKRKFTEMKNNRDAETSLARKKVIANKFYDWYYTRHPELDKRKKKE